MNREIGSEFDISIEFLLNAFHNKRLSQNMISFENVTDIAYLSNGRTAIKFILSNIIKKAKIKICWLPSYLCETVIQPFRELNLDYEFYNLKENLRLDIDYLSRRIEKNNLVFTINYFNLLHNNRVIEFLRKLEKNNAIIIEDLTHSFLNNNIFSYKISDYSIIILRKWFRIPNGGIAVSNNDSFNKKLIVKNSF